MFLQHYKLFHRCRFLHNYIDLYKFWKADVNYNLLMQKLILISLFIIFITWKSIAFSILDQNRQKGTPPFILTLSINSIYIWMLNLSIIFLEVAVINSHSLASCHFFECNFFFCCWDPYILVNTPLQDFLCYYITAFRFLTSHVIDVERYQRWM